MKKNFLLAAFWFLVLHFQISAQNVGIGTTTPLARLHVIDSSVVFSALGPASASPGNPPISSGGRRMMWYSDKAAFRAGYVSSAEWDKDNIGEYSVELGNNTLASGFASFAAGLSNNASGDGSIALGWQSTASGFASIALGFNVSAPAYVSTAMGYYTYASAEHSTAMGLSANASGPQSTAMGFSTTASGSTSTAMGETTFATGNVSTANQ